MRKRRVVARAPPLMERRREILRSERYCSPVAVSKSQTTPQAQRAAISDPSPPDAGSTRSRPGWLRRAQRLARGDVEDASVRVAGPPAVSRVLFLVERDRRRRTEGTPAGRPFPGRHIDDRDVPDAALDRQPVVAAEREHSRRRAIHRSEHRSARGVDEPYPGRCPRWPPSTRFAEIVDGTAPP